MDRVFGYCARGGQQVRLGGLPPSTTTWQQSYASSTNPCVVTVYLTGTLIPATIYGDDLGTPKSYTFNSDSTGYWFFYTPTAHYDVRFSGTLILTPFTLADWNAQDFGYVPTVGAGLNLNLSSGNVWCSGSLVTYAGGTLSLTANSTNYIYLTSSCVPAVSTTGFQGSGIPIAAATTSGSAVTSLLDYRWTLSNNGTNGLGNGTNICDMTQGACDGIAIPGGTDITTKAVACLGIQNGEICDGRGMTTVTGSVAITTTNTGGVLILPAAHWTMFYGIQVWQGAHIYGSYFGQANAGNTEITVQNGDGIYSSPLVFGAEVDHLQINAPAGHWGCNVQQTQSNFHDLTCVGGSGFLLPGGNSYYNVGNNINGVAGDPTGVAFGLFGNSNANFYGSVYANPVGGGTGIQFAGGAYNNLIDHAKIEQNGVYQSVQWTTGAYADFINMLDLESDSARGSNGWLPTFASGVQFNGIGNQQDCVDNSGNQTNVCGTKVSRPIQTYFPGKFVVTQIPNSAPNVSAGNANWTSNPIGVPPSGTYFTGGSYTIEAWAYMNLPSYPFPNNRFMKIVDIGNYGTLGAGLHSDQVIFGIDANNLYPFLQVSQGTGGLASAEGTTPVTVSALNHIVVTWNTSGTLATFYVNGAAAGTATIQAPLNVTRSTNAIGSDGCQACGNDDNIYANLMELAIYPSVLSSGTVSTHHTDGISGSANYPADVTGASPTAYWRLNDLPSSITLSAAAAAVGGNTVYTGTMPGGCSVSSYLYGDTVYISGFTNSGNNSASGAGPFVVLSCTTTTMTVTNPGGVLESHAGTAVYPGTMAATVGSNGTYSGAVTLNVQSGIPSYYSGSGKSAQFGGTTLWTYYEWMTDKSGGQTLPGSAQVVNFSTLDGNNYNAIGTGLTPVGVTTYTFARGTSAGCIAQNLYYATLPFYDNGITPGACSPATPTRNSTGDAVIPGISSAALFASATNCAAKGSAASPSLVACGSAAAGAFSCDPTASGATCVIATTAVTTNSRIMVQQSVSEGSNLSVTCNTASVLPSTPLLLSKSAGTGFTITLGTVTTNPGCFDYTVIN